MQLKDQKVMLMIDKVSFIVVFLCTLASAAMNQFMIPENTGCVCSGTRLTYNCTIMGTGNTEWSGTLFNCPANGIILRHERFSSEDVVGECNGGDVMARELGFSENCYTSELTFIANPSFNNKTVSCIHNANQGDIIIGTSVLSVEGSYPPPENITLSRVYVYQRMLTFNWSLSVPNCTQSSLSYGITFSCGSCPQTTNTTSVTCTSVHLPPDESTCKFIVHTIVCENAGLKNNSITVNIIAPDEPIVEIVPIYSGDKDRALIGIVSIVNQKDRFNSTATDNMAPIVESYKTYIDSTRIVGNNASCSYDECRYTTNVSSSVCDSSSSVSVDVRAANGVGENLPTSNPSIIACTNQFVSITDSEYNSTTFTITCRFMSQSEGSQNTCSVRSGLCTALEQSVELPSFDTANATLISSIGAYCVTATNGTYTIMVERRLTQGGQSTAALIKIIVLAVIAPVTLLVVGGVVCCCICCCYYRRREQGRKQGEAHYMKLGNYQSQRFSKSDFQRLRNDMRPHDINDSELTEVSVGNDYCSISKLLESNGLEFHRGHVYYEFSCDRETITRDKQLIFKTEDEGYLFLNADMDDKLHGECVLKPDLNNQCIVFVQSTSLGLRCLPPQTTLIYEKLSTHPMWRVDRDQYEMKKIPGGSSVKQYCENPRHSLDYKKGSVFVEYDRATDKSGQIESAISNTMFIITRKVQSKEVYYTGSQARGVVGSSDVMDSQKVLTLMTNESEEFKNDTFIWYQIPNVANIEGVTLIPIKSEQFKRVTLKEKQKLKDFQEQHRLHANDLNVLVEIGLNELGKYKDKVIDTILMHSLKDEERYFWCDFHTLFSHHQTLLKAEAVQAGKEWKVFVMCKFQNNQPLRKESSILYRAWKPNGLLPIPDYSERFIKEKHLQVDKELKLKELLKTKYPDLKRDEIDVFVKVEFVPRPILPSRDIILLMDEKEALFSGPYARNLFRRRFIDQPVSDAPEDQPIQDDQAMFVLINKDDDKKITLTSGASILCLKHGNLTQKFEVYKVDEDKVRLSKFLEDKELRPDYGKVYYELDSTRPVEDFSYYKEVVVLRRVQEHKRMGILSRKASTEFPVSGTVDCEFLSLYKLDKKTPDEEVEIRPDSDKKYFIQSLSQGSRCLKSGQCVLIMKEKIAH